MKKTAALLFAFALAISAAAQSVPSLITGTDAAALSMGGVSAALPADAFAVDNNPAAMSASGRRFDAAATYSMWSPSVAEATLAGLGAFYKLNEKLAFGLSGRVFLDKPYDVINFSGQHTGSFTPMDIVAGLGVSYAVIPSLSVGVTGRMVSSSVGPDANGTAFCADVFASYSLGAAAVTLGVSNLGTPISYGNDKYALPATVRAAGSWSGFGLTAGAEVDYLFSGALMAGVGLQYGLWDIVFVRAGFHYGDPARALPMYASLGLGVKFFGVHLDAAFLTASQTLGNTLMFTLGYSF
jgi:hypothetical protein